MSSSDLPTDHRRSDNHSESHQPQTLRSRCIGDSMGRMATGQAPLGRNSVQIADTVSRIVLGASLVATRRASAVGPDRLVVRDAAGRRIAATKNAPSRWRLRPTFRLTAAEATAYRRAINLWRSVLGASRTLGSWRVPVKAVARRLVANCVLFFSSRVELRFAACDLAPEGRKKGRAHRPGRKDSPSRERFRPPSRRTFRFRVVLLGGLRPTGAPCSAQTESRRSDGSDQGVSATKLRANCGCSAKTAESV